MAFESQHTAPIRWVPRTADRDEAPVVNQPSERMVTLESSVTGVGEECRALVQANAVLFDSSTHAQRSIRDW